MALVFGICDPDSDRRKRVRHSLPASLSGLPHLTRQSASLPPLDLYWEASASTPISIAKDRLAERERLAWVVGDFDAPYMTASDAAQRLLRRTAETSTDFRCISGQNGYYLAVLFDDTPRIVLGADALGLFPLYYWAKGDVCMFGTSPELFKHHSSFVAEPSTYGTASVLLISHISNGQSLYKGVRRASSAHYVEWTPEGIAETEANPIRMSDASFDMPYEICLERVSSCLDTFHKSLASLPQVDVFLSGGQDSRSVAGYIDRHLARRVVRAVSLGISSDQDLQYARKVSRTFGWRHRYRDVEFERYSWFATSQLRMESLQGPFVAFGIQTALLLLAERGGPFLSGYLGDVVIGDRHLRAGLSPRSGLFGFDELLGNLNGYGFSGDDTAELLSGHDGKQTVAEVIDDLRREWNAIDALPFQRAWLFQMHNRQRFHVGSIIWRLSLGAWPLLPYYDRNLLDAVTAMPLNYLRDRRMQVDIIKREFPRLATLPLDRNAVGPDYLVTPLYRKFVPHVSEVSWKLYRLLERGKERRYYHRIYDFNAPGWQSVRREAEQYRQHARNLLNPAALDRLLPAADARPDYANVVRDASKTKTLVGLVMWYGMNFGQP